MGEVNVKGYVLLMKLNRKLKNFETITNLNFKMTVEYINDQRIDVIFNYR